MRISDWSSDVCSSDLGTFGLNVVEGTVLTSLKNDKETFYDTRLDHRPDSSEEGYGGSLRIDQDVGFADLRSEEHTSELQSLMRISYAVFCLKKKKKKHRHISLIYIS